MSHQPNASTAYNVSGNPASKEPAEQSNSNAEPSGSQVESRSHQSQYSSSEATPSASGQGVRGAGTGEDPDSLSAADKGEAHADDAEQMGAPGEGKVADAVKGNKGDKMGGA